jgi:hypothetical protein
MQNSHRQFMLANALAAGFMVAVPPATGQAEQAPSQSSQIVSIPTPEESRAALMNPGPTEPSLGAPPANQPQTTGTGASAGVAEQIATGQPASAGGATTSEKAGTEPNHSIGPASTTTTPATGQTASTGPIAATGQTMPAKFSKRNDVLDRTPIMAWPQSLSDQERQRIYQAVMADKSQAAAGADALMPASQLSTDQALNGMHPMPASVGDIDPVKRLKYVKAKNKVLLVEPSTRIVVEQIKS